MGFESVVHWFTRVFLRSFGFSCFCSTLPKTNAPEIELIFTLRDENFTDSLLFLALTLHVCCYSMPLGKVNHRHNDPFEWLRHKVNKPPCLSIALEVATRLGPHSEACGQKSWNDHVCSKRFRASIHSPVQLNALPAESREQPLSVRASLHAPCPPTKLWAPLGGAD